MDSRFPRPACLVLLCGLIALGPTTAEAAGIGVQGSCAKHSAGGCRGTQPACRRGSGRAGAIATESEHERHSARYSGRKYGDQTAQMSDQCKALRQWPRLKAGRKDSPAIMAGRPMPPLDTWSN